MNALCPPPNPVCVNTGLRIVVQVFTVSGTYMPSPGLVSLVVETIGGGAGGGAITNPSATFLVTGGGGGSGGYSRKTLPAALVAGGVVVTVGAGGVSALETPGGATTFGALCVAHGGAAANANNTETQFGLPGQGAAAGVGDVAFPGSGGDAGIVQVLAAPVAMSLSGGMGGVIFGGNQSNDYGVGIGPGANALPNTGAGGQGATANQTASSPGVVTSGGDGGSGLCIVTEYCWSDGSASASCAPGARVSWPGGWDCC
jgi:hypothetical protein